MGDEIVDGTKLPRSVRWRLQLGLLKLPRDSYNMTLYELRDANEHRMRKWRGRYQELSKRYDKELQKATREKEEETKERQNFSLDEIGPNGTATDPLTLFAMKQESLEARDRKRQAQKENEGDSEQILKVIAKDLNRLGDNHSSYYKSRVSWNQHFGPSANKQNAGRELDCAKLIKKRNKLLTKLLHTYAKANPRPGYQQGMHEVCSYFMFAVEMDLFDQETQFCQDYASLLESMYICHDTYGMFETCMGQMKGAYGVGEAGHRPVEEMGESVMHKVQYVARNKELFTHIQSLDLRPELYCARWVRLLFAREVAKWQNVLAMWDIFFDLITKTPKITSMDPSKYTRPGVVPLLELGKSDLMTVIETTAASLIWLGRDKLLTCRNQGEAFEALLHLEELNDIGPLVATLLSALRRIQQSKTNMAPLLHPDEKKRQESMKNGVHATIFEKGANYLPDIHLPAKMSSLVAQTPGFHSHEHSSSSTRAAKAPTWNRGRRPVSTSPSRSRRSISPTSVFRKGFDALTPTLFGHASHGSQEIEQDFLYQSCSSVASQDHTAVSLLSGVPIPESALDSEDGTSSPQQPSPRRAGRGRSSPRTRHRKTFQAKSSFGEDGKVDYNPDDEMSIDTMRTPPSVKHLITNMKIPFSGRHAVVKTLSSKSLKSSKEGRGRRTRSPESFGSFGRRMFLRKKSQDETSSDGFQSDVTSSFRGFEPGALIDLSKIKEACTDDEELSIDSGHEYESDDDEVYAQYEEALETMPSGDELGSQKMASSSTDLSYNTEHGFGHLTKTPSQSALAKKKCMDLLLSNPEEAQRTMTPQIDRTPAMTKNMALLMGTPEDSLKPATSPIPDRTLTMSKNMALLMGTPEQSVKEEPNATLAMLLAPPPDAGQSSLFASSD